jgi:hypothetical protein
VQPSWASPGFGNSSLSRTLRKRQAKAKAQAIALRVLADQLENGETTGDLSNISFAAA